MNNEQREYIRENMSLDLDTTLEDNLMQVYSSSNWTADNKEEYDRFEALIQDYKYENELCIITAWCDISGFDYWVLQQEESNYVSIDVQFKKDAYRIDEIKIIQDKIHDCDSYFLEQLTQFQY